MKLLNNLIELYQSMTILTIKHWLIRVFFWETLGKILLKLERYDEALRTCENAL